MNGATTRITANERDTDMKEYTTNDITKYKKGTNEATEYRKTYQMKKSTEYITSEFTNQEITKLRNK